MEDIVACISRDGSPCIHHEELLSLDVISNPNSYSRLFLILLDPKFFQTTLDSSRPMTSCHVTS